MLAPEARGNTGDTTTVFMKKVDIRFIVNFFINLDF